VERRTIPGTELELSVVGLGCWAMGGLWWGDDVRDEDSAATIETALEQGCNWFDTAPLYGHGHADEVLTQTLGSRRHDVIIATKVGVRWDGSGQHANSDLTPAYIRSDTEASLTRLQLDQIPLLQVHWPCEQGTPLEQSMEELARLVEEEKVRYIGLCNYNPEAIALARTMAPIISLQTPYSILRREFEHGLQNACLQAEPSGDPLGVLIYEPLCRGLLTGKFRYEPEFPSSDLRARDDRFKGIRFLRANVLVRRLEAIAKKLGCPISALALAWVLRQKGITSVIAGAKRPEQMLENACADKLLKHPTLWPLMDRVVQAYRG